MVPEAHADLVVALADLLRAGRGPADALGELLARARGGAAAGIVPEIRGDGAAPAEAASATRSASPPADPAPGVPPTGGPSRPDPGVPGDVAGAQALALGAVVRFMGLVLEVVRGPGASPHHPDAVGVVRRGGREDLVDPVDGSHLFGARGDVLRTPWGTVVLVEDHDPPRLPPVERPPAYARLGGGDRQARLERARAAVAALGGRGGARMGSGPDGGG